MSGGGTTTAGAGGASGPGGITAFEADRALETVPGRLAGKSLAFWWTLVAIGIAGFLLGVGSSPERTWGTTWANFLFWTALAVAGVMFGAVLQTAKGHWGKGFRRLAEGMGAFLPASFLLLILLLAFGAEHVFPWFGGLEAEPRGHVNREWLTAGGVLWRNVAAVFVLYAASFYYLRVSFRPDAPSVAGKLEGWRRSLVEWIGGGWRGDEREVEWARRRLSRISPVLILLWVAVFTLLSYDLVMSLVPSFLSVVWGPYFFVGGWLCMLALLAILASHYRREYELDDLWGEWQFHDIGKLIFAFVIFWTYLWWSQFLVIWYGNLGRETLFFEQRTAGGYQALYWLQMVLTFGAPFALLLWRRPKMNPTYLALVALVVLAGFWLERHLLVLPSVWEGTTLPFGWIEIAVTTGFVGLFGLSYQLLFASTFPKLPIRETLPGRATTGP